MDILEKAKELDIIKEVEVKATSVNAEDTNVKELDDDDYVQTFSCFRGMLNLKSRDKNEFDRYTYDGFLEIKPVRFGFLKSLRRMNSKAITKPLFYISDEQAVKQLRLEREYENILDPRTLLAVLDKNQADLIEFIDKADLNTKKMLRELAMARIDNEQLVHRGKIKVLAEKLKFKLTD